MSDPLVELLFMQCFAIKQRVTALASILHRWTVLLSCRSATFLDSQHAPEQPFAVGGPLGQ